MKEKPQLSNAGAKRLAFLLKAVNKYGIEYREQIKDVLAPVQFDSPDYNEKAVWKSIDKTINWTPTKKELREVELLAARVGPEMLAMFNAKPKKDEE